MKIKGKKTYLAAALAVATAGLGYLNGDVVAADAVQLAFTGLIGAFLRSGIAGSRTAEPA